MATAKQIIDKALSYVGTFDSGTNNVIFNTDFYGKAVSGSAYPWCCAFVWDIFRMCKASNLFYNGKKTAYCPTVLSWGKLNGLSVAKNSGKYGDIVLFDWNSDGIADHIGFILGKNSDGTYNTVEGNTSDSNYSNGGYVLKRVRYQSQIIGIIRPKYDGISTDSTVTASTVPDVFYQVFTADSGWLPVVKNYEDYAGEDGQAIRGVRVYVVGDTTDVETHQMSDGNIDRITICAGNHTVRYRVRLVGGEYLDWLENRKDTGGSEDTYAGISGKAIDRLEMYII